MHLHYFRNITRSPVTTMTALLAETIGTAVLSFVIFSLTNPKNDAIDDTFIPPVIGLTVGALIACIAPLTQAGFNPARDFGPRIVAFLAGWRAVAFTKAWVYIVGPIVGALGGAFLADRILYSPTSDEEKKEQWRASK
jgi:glycerol uptake facilitator protein